MDPGRRDASKDELIPVGARYVELKLGMEPGPTRGRPGREPPVDEVPRMSGSSEHVDDV